MSDAIFDHGVTPHKSKVLKGLNFNLRCHAGPVIVCIVSVTEGVKLNRMENKAGYIYRDKQ